MPRQMTAAEKTKYRQAFPALNVNGVVVTGEISTVYNRISWTVGVTTRWLWPGPSLVDFDTFYLGFGFVRAGDGTVAAWGHSASNMKHGCVSGPGHGPRWESKCGDDLRIQHGLGELVSGTYGRVTAFYRQARTLSAANEPLAEEIMKEKTAKSYLTPAYRKVLGDVCERIPPDVRAAYGSAFAAWKASWFSGGLAFSSDPHTRTVGREYDALIAMGPAIIPLVVESLADPENFLALQLYDAIQPNGQLLVQFGPDDERILEGEQGRARRVVHTWFANR